MEEGFIPIDEYLMRWVGLVGGCVGLWMPSEMVEEMVDADSREARSKSV